MFGSKLCATRESSQRAHFSRKPVHDNCSHRIDQQIAFQCTTAERCCAIHETLKPFRANSVHPDQVAGTKHWELVFRENLNIDSTPHLAASLGNIQDNNTKYRFISFCPKQLHEHSGFVSAAPVDTPRCLCGGCFAGLDLRQPRPRLS